MTSAVKGEGNPKTDMFDKVSVIPYRVGMAVENTNHFADVKCTPNESQPPQYTPLPFSQVDPNFSYAYTLLGHEYVMIEELEKALACYRNAVRIDPRHYNAWYGIGLTYYKQERFSLADGMLIKKIRTFFICNLF